MISKRIGIWYHVKRFTQGKHMLKIMITVKLEQPGLTNSRAWLKKKAIEHVTKEGRLTLDDILDPKGHSHKHIYKINTVMKSHFNSFHFRKRPRCIGWFIGRHFPIEGWRLYIRPCKWSIILYFMLLWSQWFMAKIGRLVNSYDNVLEYR